MYLINNASGEAVTTGWMKPSETNSPTVEVPIKT